MPDANVNFDKSAVLDQVTTLEVRMREFLIDAQKTGNRAASRRARKESLNIAALLKNFRKISFK